MDGVNRSRRDVGPSAVSTGTTKLP